MLDNIKIEGFRGLEGLEIEGTSKFNLIVGQNNSGKTSLLEALFLHCAPLNCRVLLSLFSFRGGGFIPNQKYVFEGFKWFFSEPEDKNVLNLNIQGYWEGKKRLTSLKLIDSGFGEDKNSLIHVGISATNSLLMDTENEEMYSDREIEGISLGKVIFSYESDTQKSVKQEYSFTTRGPIVLPAPKIKTDVPAVYSDPFAHRGPEAGIEQYDNAVKRGHNKNCLKLLQMIDIEIQDISILLTPVKSPQLFIDHTSLGKSPITNLGDGIRRIYRLALQIPEAGNGVILIDELENSIHYSTLKEFVNWLTDTIDKMNVQVFATTHSLECIDAILTSNLGKSNQLSLFRLRKDDGKTFCKKIDGKKLEKMRYELGQDVRI